MKIKIKSVTNIIKGQETSDGDGVKLTRIIGSHELNYFDPFLLLDEFKNDNPTDYIGGFPPHPHRGFETVTYMLAGKFKHKDSKGNSGLLSAGGVQWMTAGRGIIHSEMPAQENGLVWGFQLWLNLPAKLKGIEASYQDIAANEMPVVEKDGITTKVIAGKFENKTGPGKSQTPVTYLDVELKKDSVFIFNTPATENTFVFVFSASILVGTGFDQKTINSGYLATLSEGELVSITTKDDSAKFLFLSAEKMNEPVARGGPFVMNTRAEIIQAFADYESGKLGIY